MADEQQATDDQSMLSRAVGFFLRGDIAPVLVILSLILGAVAVNLTSREEEPQIVVPMADILIRAPGMPAEEVERQVSSPLEKLLFQIDGVEHVYSASSSGQAVVTVRFHVGEDREDSLVKIYNKIFSHTDNLPPDVSSWVVKPVGIDDVPIVVVTLWSENPTELDDFHLRRIADELEIELQALPDTNKITVYGGRPRVVRVEVNAEALAARSTSVLDVAWALGVSNVRQEAGSLDRMNQNMLVDAGDYFGGLDQLESSVVNVVDGIPVFLKDVARVVDGPIERTAYSWVGFGAASEVEGNGALYPAVHVAVAKKKGTNAVTVAERLEERLEELRISHFPEGVKAMVTRNYGETANDKVNELLEALVVAIIIVVGLIAYTLGWREGLIVAAAVPITFAITLAINYWAGYTINRVTLFALILSLGLVVDDPIVGVENIYRHLRMRKGRAIYAVHGAMNEVLPPIVVATLTVIVSFLPLYLITGMMGPYMSPMALNVPVAMLASMFVSLTITPWLSYKMLKKHADDDNAHDGEVGKLEDSGMYKFYARFMAPLMNNRALARKFLWGTAALFVFAVVLGVVRAVPLKMLPFDNKNEFQIVVNMPEGVTLERTDALTRKLANVVATAPEVTNYAIYTGLASPMDFNGLVRHYFMRQGPTVAEIRVNLVGKRYRSMNSHEILLRLRNDLEAIAVTEGASIALVEVPAGPPVLSTVTVEVSGAPNVPYDRIRDGALIVAERLKAEPGVGDVDTSVEADATRYLFVTDQE
ncbi:MAG: efflux RND transporter permease subunit [Sphingomonadales bacterium]|nr:efflux RND transporter permease subunit [Sphingomonadales bacterium]